MEPFPTCSSMALAFLATLPLGASAEEADRGRCGKVLSNYANSMTVFFIYCSSSSQNDGIALLPRLPLGMTPPHNLLLRHIHQFWLIVVGAIVAWRLSKREPTMAIASVMPRTCDRAIGSHGAKSWVHGGCCHGNRGRGCTHKKLS